MKRPVAGSLLVVIALAMLVVPAEASTSVKKRPTVGTTVKVPGWKVTFLEYLQPAPATIFAPDPGTEIASIEVQVCATKRRIEASPTQFVIELGNHHRPESDIGDLDDFHTATLLKGDCVRGWTSFVVPAGKRARWVIFDSEWPLGGGYIVRWRVPRA